MGGFMLFVGKQPLYPLTLDEIYSLVDAGYTIDFPDITEDEIIDRSNGDVLSKGLVILQTGWFVVQCVARGVERLPVTKLELVMVGFATLFVTMGYEDYYVDLTAEKAFATFYAGDLEVKPVASAALCATVIPIIFGAIHRIAWLFPFPTHTE